MEQVGYEIKRGKYTAVRGKRQKGLLDFVLWEMAILKKTLLLQFLEKIKKQN